MNDFIIHTTKGTFKRRYRTGKTNLVSINLSLAAIMNNGKDTTIGGSIRRLKNQNNRFFPPTLNRDIPYAAMVPIKSESTVFDSAAIRELIPWCGMSVSLKT
jgi:hypothetical protein